MLHWAHTRTFVRST